MADGQSGVVCRDLIDRLNPETTWDHKNQTRAALGGKRSFACGRSNGNVAPIPAVRRQSGNLSGSDPKAVVQVRHLDGSS